MRLIDLDSLDEHQLYIITGGEGYSIPYGLYKCDEYGSTEGTPVKTFDFDLEKYNSENRDKLIQTILQNEFTIGYTIENTKEPVEFHVVDVDYIKDVAEMYDFIDGDEFKKFLYED